MTKQGLIDSIKAAAPPGNVDVLVLELKSIDQLKEILADAITNMVNEQNERLLEAQADRTVSDAVWKMEMTRANEPRIKAEREALEKANRSVFHLAAKRLRYSVLEANYSVLVKALGELSTDNIREFMAANPSALVAATPAEVQQWTQEAQVARAEYLRNAPDEELRAAVRHDFQERRAQAQQAEAERQIAGREAADAAFGFPPLPETNQITGEKIDGAYLTRISNTNLQLFKNFIRTERQT